MFTIPCTPIGEIMFYLHTVRQFAGEWVGSAKDSRGNAVEVHCNGFVGPDDYGATFGYCHIHYFIVNGVKHEFKKLVSFY